MNWKTRQLFSDREHGIVSGLSPLNMMGGGTVSWPNYQDGTSPEEAEYLDDMLLEAPEEPSIEQRVADLATEMGISPPEARAMILNQMLEQQGLILSDEIINQFATGLITLQDALAQAVDFKAPWDQETEAPFEAIDFKAPWDQAVGAEAGGAALREGVTEAIQGMQGGGLALDLFEEGDQDINEPLNRMAQAVSPSIADITPTETVEETVPLTEDQGPTDVSALKQAFQQLAIQAVQAANDAIEQGAPVEQVEGPLQERLLMIDEQYRQKSGMQDTILTEEFLAQLDTLSDISAEPIAMQDGGMVFEITELTEAQVDLKRAKGALATHKAKKRGSGQAAWSRYDTRSKQLEAAVQTAQEIVNSLLSDASNITGVSTDGPAAKVADEADAAKREKEEKEKIKKELKRDLSVKPLDIAPALTTQGFWEDMKANAARARLGTMMSGKSKQGGILGTMDVLGQAELAGSEALGDAQRAMLSELGETERTAALLGRPTSLTKEERDFARGNPLFAQQLFLKRLGPNVDMDEVVEEFIKEGIPLPAFNGVVISGLGGIVTTKDNTKVDFARFYRDSKANDPNLKFEAIRTAWEKAKADPENTYTA